MPSTAEQSQRGGYAPPLGSFGDWLNRDFYEILQVSPRAEPEVIEVAFRRLAFKYHPDRNNSPEATRRMQEINQAYTVLKDLQQRALYDANRNQPIPEAPIYDNAPVENAAPPPAPEAESVYYQSDYDWESLSYEAPTRIPDWKRNLLYLMVGFILTILMITAISVFAQSSSAQPHQSESPHLIPANLLFMDDFETVGTANWSLEEPWHLTSRLAASGTYALWFGEENYGRYRIGLNTSATLLRPLDLGDAQHPAVVFQITGQTDNPPHNNNQDKLLVEVANPGQPFTTVYTASGLYNNWETVRVDLSKWSSKVIQVRLRFVSGPGNVGNGYAGFFVDDFRIEK